MHDALISSKSQGKVITLNSDENAGCVEKIHKYE